MTAPASPEQNTAPRRRGRPRKVRPEDPVPAPAGAAASPPEAALLRAQSVIDSGSAPGAGRASAEARILSGEKLSAFAAARLSPKDSLRRLGERWLDAQTMQFTIVPPLL